MIAVLAGAGGGFKQPATETSKQNERTAKNPSTSTERKPGHEARKDTSLSVAHAYRGCPSGSVGSAFGRSRAQLDDHDMNDNTYTIGGKGVEHPPLNDETRGSGGMAAKYSLPTVRKTSLAQVAQVPVVLPCQKKRKKGAGLGEVAQWHNAICNVQFNREEPIREVGKELLSLIERFAFCIVPLCHLGGAAPTSGVLGGTDDAPVARATCANITEVSQ